MFFGPRRDGLELACGPDEGPFEGSVVGSVISHAVARGDHIVESESVGEWFDQVIGRRGGEHDGPASCARCMAKAASCERLHHGDQTVSYLISGRTDRRLGVALGKRDRLACEGHRRQRLADRVEETKQQLFSGKRLRRQTGRTHGVGKDLPGCPSEQRAVEIKERGAVVGGRPHRPAGSSGCSAVRGCRHAATLWWRARSGPEKWERPGWGSGSLNLGTSAVGGTDMDCPDEWNNGGCSHVDCVLVKVCTCGTGSAKKITEDI